MRFRSSGALPFLLAAPCFAQSPAPQEAAKTMVRDFYIWYVGISLKHHKLPTEIVALRTKGPLFSARLTRALQEDWAARQKSSDDIVGLDFDPFLNAQDLAQRYQAGDAVLKNGHWFVDVHSAPTKKTPDVVAEVAQEKGRWVFVNFHYPGGPDLLQQLQQLAKERAASHP